VELAGTFPLFAEAGSGIYDILLDNVIKYIEPYILFGNSHLHSTFTSQSYIFKNKPW